MNKPFRPTVDLPTELSSPLGSLSLMYHISPVADHSRATPGSISTGVLTRYVLVYFLFPSYNALRGSIVAVIVLTIVWSSLDHILVRIEGEVVVDR